MGPPHIQRLLDALDPDCTYGVSGAAIIAFIKQHVPVSPPLGTTKKEFTDALERGSKPLADPGEAQRLGRVMMGRGMIDRKIAKELNRLGIADKHGNPWRPQQMSWLLRKSRARGPESKPQVKPKKPSAGPDLRWRSSSHERCPNCNKFLEEQVSDNNSGVAELRYGVRCADRIECKYEKTLLSPRRI